MYQRRGGKVRADEGKLNAELVTGVAVGSGNNGGKRQVLESAPPPHGPTRPRTEQMRRPSTPSSNSAAANEAEEKERTKKQLESITGRMFQVLNDFEDDEDSNTQSSRVERRHLISSARTHNRRMMQSNIDGMMANYDQISTEREELLESLADWFQQGHIDASDRPSMDLSLNHAPPLNSRAREVSERLRAVDRELLERAGNGTPHQDLQLEREKLESELAASLPGQIQNNDGGTAARRDAVTMSWKYAAMEIYGLLSDVRDTDAEEMNTLEQRITELVSSLAQQSQMIESLSADLQQQKELVYFSDKTTQGLAAENSDLREQLDRVRGQLVKARNATKTATVKDSCHGKGRVSGGEGGKGGGEREVGRGDSGEGGKVEVYRAQIKDLNKRLAQLEEKNKKLQLVNRQPKEQEQEREEEETSPHSSEAVIETTSIHHPHHTPPPSRTSPSLLNVTPPSHSQTEHTTQNMDPENDNTARELCALRKELQVVMAEKTALEEECRRRREEGKREGEEREESREREEGRGEREGLRVQHCQYKSQHTQTVTTDEKRPMISPPQRVISHLSPPTTHSTHPSPTSTHTSTHHTAAPSTITTTTALVTSDSTVAKATAEPDVPFPTSIAAMETVAKDTIPVPSIMVETVTMDTVAQETTVEIKTGVVEMMEDTINKIITNQSDFITADSATLHRIHGNLQGVCDVILSCLLHSSMPEGEDVDDVMHNVVENLHTRLPENDNQVLINQSNQAANIVDHVSMVRDGGREMSEMSERPATREEMKMFVGQAIQSIHDGGNTLSSTAHAQQDKLQRVFEAIQKHRRRSQLSTITYPLPAHFLSHGGAHIADLHRSGQQVDHPHLELSVSVMGVASAHNLHDYTHNKVPAHHGAQQNSLLYPWGHPFRANTHHLHHPPHISPLTSSPSPSPSPSPLTSPHHYPLVTTGGLGGLREGGERRGGREGKKGRTKKKVRHSQVPHSSFLQVGNTLSAPPRTAPAGLKGVATSLGNHRHGDLAPHAVRSGSKLLPNNDSAGATFIDLLMQTPRVANGYHSDGNSGHSNTSGAAGRDSIKLPTIQ